MPNNDEKSASVCVFERDERVTCVHVTSGRERESSECDRVPCSVSTVLLCVCAIVWRCAAAVRVFEGEGVGTIPRGLRV